MLALGNGQQTKQVAVKRFWGKIFKTLLWPGAFFPPSSALEKILGCDYAQKNLINLTEKRYIYHHFIWKHFSADEHMNCGDTCAPLSKSASTPSIEVTFETVCLWLNVWSVNYPFCDIFCITAYYIRSLKTWHIFLLYLRNTTYKYNAHSSSLITFKSALRLRLVLTK